MSPIEWHVIGRILIENNDFPMARDSSTYKSAGASGEGGRARGAGGRGDGAAAAGGMAVSCPEVMYGAYYPYLYGRGAARSFHHAPHFQYDRDLLCFKTVHCNSATRNSNKLILKKTKTKIVSSIRRTVHTAVALYPEDGYRALHAVMRNERAARLILMRLNVQSGGNAGEYGGGAATGGAAALSSGSASSGAQSPGSPPHAHALPHHAHHAHLAHHAHQPAAAHHSPRLRTKEEDLSAHGRASADGGGSSESEGECGGARARAQYVSANCVVFTHYSGDVAAVVDEHFARALALDKPKEGVPMSSRNLPASFFNATAGPACAGLDLYDYDPWHQHYAGYGHAAHRHAAEYHAAAAHHNMAAAGYGGLLLGRGSLHAQYKPVDWPHAAHHAHHAHHASPHLDPAACSPYSYPAPPGLEAQVQDTSKDLYWF
ncbi:protein vestigial [Melitaea cinxia]|uniref:protein vestigial n=1 Tax=Melitaea cinxia TaxID=113334 RepID=UPI001E2710B0|nr:protein vestigial [Melitaea cinxia]